MRSTRISNPLPMGKGFSVGGVVVLAAILAVAAALPARAANVTVTLDVSFAEPLAHLEWARCDVSVAEGANGKTVLTKAVDAGCIGSWSGQDTQFGTYVVCIDEICGNDALYWRMTVGGDLTDYGVDDFDAGQGDVLGFSYAQWLTCVPGPPLPC